MPSLTSMWQHWLRSCWIAKTLCNSTKEDPYNNLPYPELCGWCKNEGGVYTYDWEFPEVQSRVTETINFLTKGCTCKKGCYNQCGCRRKRSTCGPGCQCQGCKNVGAVPGTQASKTDGTDTESEHSYSQSSSDQE